MSRALLYVIPLAALTLLPREARAQGAAPARVVAVRQDIVRLRELKKVVRLRTGTAPVYRSRLPEAMAARLAVRPRKHGT